MARPRVFESDEALAKAMMVFWQQGYCATSLDDLEATMGLKRQSIYNVFGDKRSLFLKALRFYREQGVAFVEQQLTQFKSPKASLYNIIHNNEEFFVSALAPDSIVDMTPGNKSA
ncbi:hypothetical protein RIVM261_002340 [Rivularia sp. IAM M-261]|nr:hypothetical protein RIVM261_002340 [Rivularia sp. IAM M-261]